MDAFWKSKVAERYEYIEELGKGGIGTVILARDKTLDKNVAIKILNANLSNEESVRFQREAVLSGRLKHENIVSVLDFGITDTNVPYLIMEHLRGSSLADMLTEGGAFEVLFAVQIFQQICRGMKSSHNQDVVHRDLKPANIIMERNDDDTLSAKIVDFGLARLTDKNLRLTTTGTAIGSPLYMSPEQAQGQPGDERSDIYSMGCLMYKVLTDSTPFTGETPVQTLMMHQSAKPDPLSARTEASIPPKLEEIVAKCLKKLPRDRYQSFSSLLHDLEKLESEMIRLEREAAYEAAASRSGIQRALSSVTDFSTPLTTMSKKKISTVGIVIVAVLVPIAFLVYLLLPQFTEKTEDRLPESEFQDNLKSFREMKAVKEKDGRITCKAYGENTDVDLKQIQKEHRLDRLDLSSSSCVGTGLSALRKSIIIDLNMDSSPVNDDGMKEIGRVKGLTSLSVRDCYEIEDASLAHLARCQSLETLSFSGKGLTENCFKYLEKYPSLIWLRIDKFRVTQAEIAEILKIPTLQSIVFEECELEASALKQLQSSKKSFQSVGLEDTKLTTQMVAQLKSVPTRYITLDDVEMTKSVLLQIVNDRQFRWTDTKVDGKDIPDRE